MERELRDRNHQVGREVAVPLYYKVHELCTYKLDMLVDDKLIIEIKSSAELPNFGPEPKFYRQCALNKNKKRRCVPDRTDPPDRFTGPQVLLGESEAC